MSRKYGFEVLHHSLRCCIGEFDHFKQSGKVVYDDQIMFIIFCLKQICPHSGPWSCWELGGLQCLFKVGSLTTAYVTVLYQSCQVFAKARPPNRLLGPLSAFSESQVALMQFVQQVCSK